jgi:two-component system KDP operon response regulator KdpE
MTAGGILVIDDTPQTHRFLKPALEAAGYAVDRADTAAQGVRLATARTPQMILLDLGLPDQDGQDTLLLLRRTTSAPIVVISARDQEAEKVRALDNGADDYVQKPFLISELLARVRACLRRSMISEGTQPRWRSRDLEVDLVRRTVLLAGRYIALSQREYDVLALLVAGAGRVVTHRQLLTGVWGPAHAEHVQYLRVYIGHLRHKLGPTFTEALATEPGVGYRLSELAG